MVLYAAVDTVGDAGADCSRVLIVGRSQFHWALAAAAVAIVVAESAVAAGKWYLDPVQHFRRPHCAADFGTDSDTHSGTHSCRDYGCTDCSTAVRAAPTGAPY